MNAESLQWLKYVANESAFAQLPGRDVDRYRPWVQSPVQYLLKITAGLLDYPPADVDNQVGILCKRHELSR